MKEGEWGRLKNSEYIFRYSMHITVTIEGWQWNAQIQRAELIPRANEASSRKFKRWVHKPRTSIHFLSL